MEEAEMGVKVVGRLGKGERLFWIGVASYTLVGITKRIPSVFGTYLAIASSEEQTSVARLGASIALFSGIGLTMIAIGCVVAIVCLLRGDRRGVAHR